MVHNFYNLYDFSNTNNKNKMKKKKKTQIQAVWHIYWKTKKNLM